MHWKRNVALFIGSQFITMFAAMLTQYAIIFARDKEIREGGDLDRISKG